MLKTAAKKLLGERGRRAVTMGCQALKHYPAYALGGGRAAVLRRIDLEITFECNARCRMCPLYGEHMDNSPLKDVHAGRAELSTDEIKALLRDSREMGVGYFKFSGGEPFLRGDLCELISYASSLGIATEVNTNGSIMTPELAARVVTSGLDRIHLSIDGPAEIHNNVRRVPELYERADRSVALLREAQNRLGRHTPTVSVGCTVSSLNQGHLRSMVDLAERWKASLSFCRVFYSTPEQDERTRQMCPPGTAKPESWNLPARIRLIDVDALHEELRDVQRLGQERGVTVSSNLADKEYLWRHYYEPDYAEANKCMYPWYATRVNPYGDVYPCSVMADLGNIRQGGIQSVWNGPRYVQFRNKLRQVGLFPKCTKCTMLDRDNIVAHLLPRLAFTAGI